MVRDCEGEGVAGFRMFCSSCSKPPPPVAQDQDGKECVEYTRELVGHEGRAEVEGSGSITCEKDPLIKPHAEKKSKPHIWVNILDARGRPTKYFTHRRLRYIYSDEEEKFVLLV